MTVASGATTQQKATRGDDPARLSSEATGGQKRRRFSSVLSRGQLRKICAGKRGVGSSGKRLPKPKSVEPDSRQEELAASSAVVADSSAKGVDEAAFVPPPPTEAHSVAEGSAG